ncbi:isopenicillin N synthase family oxygenase [Kibdelosporangium persicum]|uniref:Small molecule metabolism n=1 Tax=Kibdelosporangium persicum TaxID=2698649 RepID=A0ABX2FF62_9PSEU|nr:isopenicillin N synthase family oxygenase [Kibdelosporangium persicum]NRN69937.1 Small molecule metabolism [Kibdelosporangium persicum]
MADVGTFGLPEHVGGSESDVRLAGELITAWRTDGMARISCDRWQARKVRDAVEASGGVFRQPAHLKSRCVSDLTYAGYSAAGAVETFAIFPDVPREDVRVGAHWPGHGPVPWPSMEYRRTMRLFTDELGRIGEKLMRLVSIGLELPDFETLPALTEDGWHHMFVQRFPSGTHELSSHGLLMITVEDGTLTATPGELMEFLTGGRLRTTSLEALVHTDNELVMTYFHEPAFDAGLRPVLDPAHDYVHYGTYLTDVFMRRYPQRVTTQRIKAEDRLSVLATLSRRASVDA